MATSEHVAAAAMALHAADTSRNTPTTRRSSHDTQVS